MTNSKIPAAVIGVGRMGRHHARIYSELPQAELVAVVDANEERAAIMADNYGAQFYTSVTEMIAAHPEVQAATIAVPTTYHLPVAKELLAAGVNCLIEKPLAGSVEEAQQIVDLAKAADKLVQVGHTERFNPAFRAIKDMNFIPRFIEVDRVSPMTFRSIDVGVVFDLMIHDLDIVGMLVGRPIKKVDACSVSVLGEAEDVADARIEFEGGCIAKMTASRLALKNERKLRIFSEAGYIVLDYQRKTGMAMLNKGNVDELVKIRERLANGEDITDLDYTELVNVQELQIEDEEPLKAELENFLAASQGEVEPEVPGEAGLAAVAAAEWVIKASADHDWEGVQDSPGFIKF